MKEFKRVTLITSAAIVLSLWIDFLLVFLQAELH